MHASASTPSGGGASDAPSRGGIVEQKVEETKREGAQMCDTISPWLREEDALRTPSTATGEGMLRSSVSKTGPAPSVLMSRVLLSLIHI